MRKFLRKREKGTATDWLAQSVELAALDLRVVSLGPISGAEMT